MTALLEQVWAQVSQLPDAEQDAIAARLLAALTEFQQEQAADKPRPRFGSAKGLGYMAPDFKEPLEEFKEYMG
jgi:hypothetical protein